MESILEEIKQERVRQNQKFGEQNHKPIEWIAILSEEVGEAAKEALDHHFEYPEKTESGKQECNTELQAQRLKDYRKELIQVAAVAVQMIECLDRNRKS
ncbi:MAG: hypothetical protein ACPGLV_00650 [Bacteroidia bacterium]